MQSRGRGASGHYRRRLSQSRPLRILLPSLVVVVAIGGAAALAIRDRGGPPASLAPLPSTPVPTPAGGDLFVSPSGNDGSAGTSQAPFATIQRAVDSATAGATIWLYPGTYAAVSIRGTDAPRALRIAGIARGQAIVDGASGPAAITIEGTHDVELLDLVVLGPSGSAKAAVLIERSTNVTIAGSTIERAVGGFGIEARYSADITIRGNDIAHNAVGIRLYGEGDPTSVHDILIEDNWIHDSDSMVVNDAAPNNDFGGNGIIWHKVEGSTVARGNQIWATRAQSHDYGVDGGAFEIWGSSNMEITQNTTWDNVNVMETGSDGPECSNITFTYNVAYATHFGVGMILRCASNSLVAHNVFDNLYDYAMELSDRNGGNLFARSIDGLRILDNIVAGSPAYAMPNQVLGSVTADANLLWNPGGPLATLFGGRRPDTLSELRDATSFDEHSVTGDPRFVDEPHRDYRVFSDSPAIDRGIPLAEGESFQGAAPDIGPYEGGIPVAPGS